MKRYHTAAQEAERLGVSLRTILTWQAQRRIPSPRLSPGRGGIIRFDPEAVDEALTKFTVSVEVAVPAEHAAQADGRTSQSL